MTRLRLALAGAWLTATLALAALSPGHAAAQASRLPYLQRTTSTEVTLAWRDETPGVDGACVGSSPTTLIRHVGGTSTTRDHAVVVDGLTPLSRWYYAVRQATCPPATAGDARDHFVTAPAPGEAAPFRIWVVGDGGTGGTRQREVRDAALDASADRSFDLFVHVGDMAYNTGTTAEFDTNFFAAYAEILRSTPVYPAIGNHEGSSSDSATQTGPYYEAYVTPTDGRAGGLASGTEAYYAYDWGNVHFVVLDSHESPREPTGAMLRWLEADLAATSATWIVAYWHHPPYTDGSHDSDTEGQLIDMRENALPILEAHGVDLVLTGHSHIYERSYLLHGGYETPSTTAGIVDRGDGRPEGDGPYRSGPAGALYVVAGHGGAGISGDAMHPVMFFSELRHGSTILDVSGESLSLRNVRYDGVESDHCTLVKSEGLFVTAPREGSVYRPSTPVALEWFHVGAPIATVDVDVSYDRGRTWEPVVASTENDGLHVWTAPAEAHPAVQLRVTDAARPDVSATSGFFSLAGVVEETTIPLGSVWQYHDTAEAPPAGWATGEGASWPEGPAELGFGDGDEATVLVDLDPNVPSTYFRRRIDVGRARVRRARIRGLYDDAIAVLVNGEVVYQRHVDGGLGHDVFSSGTDGDDAPLASTEIPVDAFLPGESWIAAIVKQDAAGSSDLSFDLELVLELEAEIIERPDAGPAPDAAVAPTDDAAVTPTDDAATSTGDDAGPAGGSGDGCGCRVGASRDGRAPRVLALLLVGLVLARRRRKGPARAHA
jgi:MYXO-CTERM domain-containing protein